MGCGSSAPAAPARIAAPVPGTAPQAPKKSSSLQKEPIHDQVTPAPAAAPAPAPAEEPPYPPGEEPKADENGMPLGNGEGEGEGEEDGMMERGLKAQPKPKAGAALAAAAPAAAAPKPPPAPDRAPFKRALLIGCNYVGSRVQLAGCKNDTLAMAEVVAGFWQGGGDTHWLLDPPNTELDPRPTKANILAELAWLTGGGLAGGDQLFLYYSGHGKQVADTSGDEADGKDEALVPLDYESAGVLTDDELGAALLAKIPAGARLTIITDACHSGTVLDLPYRYSCNSITRDGRKPRKPYNFQDWTSNTRESTEAALVARYAKSGSIVFYSSSQDEQTSATTIMAVDNLAPAPSSLWIRERKDMLTAQADC